MELGQYFKEHPLATYVWETTINLLMVGIFARFGYIFAGLFISTGRPLYL